VRDRDALPGAELLRSFLVSNSRGSLRRSDLFS
jgi:hypothetical protein